MHHFDAIVRSFSLLIKKRKMFLKGLHNIFIYVSIPSKKLVQQLFMC
jgi:hypothetical protein